MTEELKVKMEVWRFIRQTMEDDLGQNEHAYCPDSFAITAMLETGEPPSSFPKANLPTATWWHLLKELYKRGARHGNDMVEVMMSTRRDVAPGITWRGCCDWYVSCQILAPGQVQLSLVTDNDARLADAARRFFAEGGWEGDTPVSFGPGFAAAFKLWDAIRKT